MDESLVSEKLNRIDDAVTRIRTKTDTSDNLIEDVASAVEAFAIPEGTLSITENGVYDVTSYVSTDVAIPLPSGSISITENGQYDVTSYVNASVLVGQTIDWTEIGYSSEPESIQDGFDYAKNIKDNWTSGSMWSKFSNDYKLMFMPYVNTSNSEIFANAFSYCSSLINVPLLDTSNGTDFSNMFVECGSLKTIPQFDTPKLTNCRNMFLKCYSLESVPLFDTSKSTNVSYMFSDCKSLKTIPQFDTSNATNVSQMLYQCESINNVPELDFGNATSVIAVISNYSGTLINLNGFKDIGKAYSTTMSANTYQYTLSLQINSLSHDSLMNVINKVYDIATKGCNTQRLILGSSNVAKLTAEEIAIATNKGWTVS